MTGKHGKIRLWVLFYRRHSSGRQDPSSVMLACRRAASHWCKCTESRLLRLRRRQLNPVCHGVLVVRAQPSCVRSWSTAAVWADRTREPCVGDCLIEDPSPLRWRWAGRSVRRLSARRRSGGRRTRWSPPAEYWTMPYYRRHLPLLFRLAATKSCSNILQQRRQGRSRQVLHQIYQRDTSELQTEFVG